MGDIRKFKVNFEPNQSTKVYLPVSYVEFVWVVGRN
jgi:hypothetical protein